MNCKQLVTIAATVASFCVATTAHAYKVDDTLEIKAKLFANWQTFEGDPNGGGFHLGRNYVEVRKHISDTDMVRVTLDQKGEADSTGTFVTVSGIPDTTGKAVTKNDGKIFVKYAYWQHTFPFSAKLKVGQHHTPFVDYDNNDFWGYRFVAKAYTDEWGLQTSSDSGVSLLGTAADKKVEYYFSVLNGEGYQHTVDGHGYAFAARVQANINGIHAGVVTHDEGNRGGASNYDPTRRLVFAFFENDTFRVGGQYLVDADDGAGAKDFAKGTGYNVQGSVKLPFGNHASAFARFDSVDKKDTGVDETLTIAGVSFEAAKGVTLAPNMQIMDNGVDTNAVYGINAQFKF
ncbi:MAG: hypothetical protein OEY97_00210 [Nitrospirota bacterium]|nr:hypothetical protein [Nitrospirota bacterium]